MYLLADSGHTVDPRLHLFNDSPSTLFTYCMHFIQLSPMSASRSHWRVQDLPKRGRGPDRGEREPKWGRGSGDGAPSGVQGQTVRAPGRGQGAKGS